MPIPSQPLYSANGHGAGVHDATLIDEFVGKSLSLNLLPDTVIDLGLNGTNPKTLKKK